MSRLFALATSTLLLAGLSSIASASTVQLTNMHMAAATGANQPAVTNYPSGTTNAYFDYTVSTTSSEQTQVQIIGQTAGGSGLLDVTATGNRFLAMSVPGNWPDGDYCVDVKVTGTYDTFGGQLLFGFTVGSNQPTPTRSTPTVARISHFSTHRHGPRLMFTWHVADASGLAGFNLYAHGKRLNEALVSVHRSREYRVSARWTKGPYAVRPVLTNT